MPTLSRKPIKHQQEQIRGDNALQTHEFLLGMYGIYFPKKISYGYACRMCPGAVPTFVEECIKLYSYLLLRVPSLFITKFLQLLV